MAIFLVVHQKRALNLWQPPLPRVSSYPPNIPHQVHVVLDVDVYFCFYEVLSVNFSFTKQMVWGVGTCIHFLA